MSVISNSWCDKSAVSTGNVEVSNSQVVKRKLKGKIIQGDHQKHVTPAVCISFPSVLWHCWLGDGKGIRPVKKLDVGLSVVMIWLELCTTYSSSCHHHLHHPLLQQTLTNSGSPGKWPLKRRERFAFPWFSRM